MFLITFNSICFVYFGNDLYFRLNPYLMYHEEYIVKPERIKIDPISNIKNY